jgi:hypothetical protein
MKNQLLNTPSYLNSYLFLCLLGSRDNALLINSYPFLPAMAFPLSTANPTPGGAHISHLLGKVLDSDEYHAQAP